VLPEIFEIEYIEEVYQLEESKNMAYVCTAERLGIKKGRIEGINIAMEKMALFLIKKGIDEDEILHETGLTLEHINALKEKESLPS
jgi:predicted transposase/invertase (TIGR01784 family)